MDGEKKESEGTGAANPLTRKLNKILNGDGVKGMQGPSEDVVEALRGLSGFFKSNTKRARANLRGDLERRSLIVNEEFLAALEGVHKKLETVHGDIQDLSKCCADMSSRLQAARADTKQLIQKTTSLEQESNTVNIQRDVLGLFMDRFVLRDEEKKALLPSARELSEEFFAAFARAKTIHEDCKVLLRTSHQRAGLSIMEAMAALQESAYERLYRWTQTACRGLNSEMPEHPALLCRAFGMLRDRPVLLQYCMKDLADARRNVASRAFIDALTRGGPGGVPKPIELFSHDAVRYTSDMLAWLHQCVASERELLSFLLAPPPTPDAPISRRRVIDIKMLPVADQEALLTALDHTMEAMCRPLKVRIEQVLAGDPGLVVCFKLAGVLQFYAATIGGLAGETAALSALLTELRSNTLKMCFDALSVQANGLLAKVEYPQPDLSTPLALDTTLDMLRQVLASQDSTVSAADIHRAELTKILTCVLDPLMHMCALSSSKLPPAEMATFMLNCHDRILSCLALFEFTEDKASQISQQSSAHLATLVAEQGRAMLEQSGFGDVFAVLQAWEAIPEPRPALSSMPSLDATTLAMALARLADYAAALGHTRPCPQCDLLVSTRHREFVLREAVQAFLHLYSRLHTRLAAEGQAALLGKRTPDQIASLLS
eukprot:m.78466 g.78466  ORF g.78466 m.78466 type:complete len:660 (+) comp7966_c0_seq2:23-2002(+)